MRKSFLIILLALISSFGAYAQRTAVGASAETDWKLREQHALATGVGILASGRVQDGHDIFLSLTKSSPQNSEVWFYLAKSLHAKGKVDDALRAVENAARLDTTQSDYQQLLGQILIETEQYDRAERIFDRLIVSEPSNAQNYIISAALAMELTHPREALDRANEFEKLFGIDERMVDIKRGAHVEMKQYYDALEYMQRVVQALPSDPRQLVVLGDVNAGLGLDKAALDCYEQAIALDSLDSSGYLALARFWDVKGDMGRYITALNRIFALSSVSAKQKIELFEASFFTPSPYREHMIEIRRLAQTLLFAENRDLQAMLLYGRFLGYIGKVDEARLHYATMLEAGMKNREVYDRVMDIQFYQKDYNAALSTSEVAMLDFPNDFDLTVRRIAAISMKIGGAKEALVELRKALARHKTDSLQASLYALQGDIEHEAGRDRRAFAAYDRSLRLKADNALVLNNYAYFLSLRRERLTEALAMAERASELQPDFSTYLDTQAWVLFELGRLDQAAAIQQRALALDTTGSAELLIHYGDILYALGDDFMARNYWKKALEAGGAKEQIDERMARPKAKRNAQ